MARTRQHDCGASDGNPGGHRRFRDWQAIDVTQLEEQLETLRQPFGAAPDPFAYIRTLRRLIRRLTEKFHAIVRIHYPRTFRIEQVVERIVVGTIGSCRPRHCTLGRRALCRSEMVENFEFQNPDKPGAQGGSAVERIALPPGDEQALLNEILGLVMISYAFERVGIELFGLLHQGVGGDD